MAFQNDNMSTGLKETQEAVTFINKTVLQPNTKPLAGTAGPMIDQAKGMMVQDLQSFLQGFEQVGLIAIAKLLNKTLKSDKMIGEISDKDNPVQSDITALTDANTSGVDSIDKLFKTVSEYGVSKAKINTMMSLPIEQEETLKPKLNTSQEPQPDIIPPKPSILNKIFSKKQ